MVPMICSCCGDVTVMVPEGTPADEVICRICVVDKLNETVSEEN